VDRGLQQRRLPDARIAGEHQRGAVTGAAVDEPANQCDVVLPADELGRLLVGTVAHTGMLRTPRGPVACADGVI